MRGGPGGSRQLRHLLTRYGGAIEADLHRYHQVRLNQALYGRKEDRIPAREILNWIRYLPRDSAFAHEVLGDQADWQVDTHLLAHVAFLLAGANWQRGGGKGTRPKPIKPKAAKPKPAPPGGSKTSGQQCSDVVRRLANLGLIPGQQPQPAPLTPQQQRLSEALQRAQQHPQPAMN